MSRPTEIIRTHRRECIEVKRTLDVRQVPISQRPSRIFQTFEALQPGEAFILVSDDDPEPLYDQFDLARQGPFTWEYLEYGPEVWRVGIRRVGLSAGMPLR